MSAHNPTWVTLWNFYLVVCLILISVSQFLTFSPKLNLIYPRKLPLSELHMWKKAAVAFSSSFFWPFIQCAGNHGNSPKRDLWKWYCHRKLRGCLERSSFSRWQMTALCLPDKIPPSSNVQLHMEIGNHTLSHWQTITTMSLAATLGMKPLTKHNVAHHASHQKKHRM